jgi:hypothetical protein
MVENNNFILLEDNIVQKHYCNLFHGHEDYKLLTAVRNPY